MNDVLSNSASLCSALEAGPPLAGRRAAMLLFGYYPDDTRPRRAAETLVSQGMRVDLICLRESDRDPRHDVIRGVNIRRLPITQRRGGIFAYLFQYLAYLFASSAILAVRSLFGPGYDLVYVNNMPDFLVLSGLIPKFFGAKIVLDLHDPMPEVLQTIFDLPANAKSVRFLKWIEKRSIGLADSVITVNRACERLFASRSSSIEKITVIMNSPDEDFFRWRNPEIRVDAHNGVKPFVVMYHGSLVERNGLSLAVDAFSRIHNRIPSAELRIYGSRNPFLEEVMASIRGLGLETSVRYLGPKSVEEIVEAIEDCDVGIIPNPRNIFTELNTPTRIFEYLALGKPVVAPRAKGVTDYFEEDSLVFFEMGNTEDLARKIEYVYRNPGEVMGITRRGQQVYRSHAWQTEKSRLANLVEELLKDRRGKLASVVAVPQRNQQGR